MARPSRRLILNLGAVAGALLLLAAAALAILVLFVDAETFRPRLEREARDRLGREVSLGRLHWDLGWRIGLASSGGFVANAPGFEGAQLARWHRISFGLALRPLLHREAEVDHLEVEGLELDLQRNAAGMANWNFDLSSAQGDAEANGGTARFSVRQLSLRDARLRFRDAASARDLKAEGVSLDVKLPLDLTAAQLPFADLELALPVQELPLSLEAGRVLVMREPLSVEVPAFSGRLDESRFAGAARYEDTSGAAELQLQVSSPSLREQFAHAGRPLPAMRDADAPGPALLHARASWDGRSLKLTELSAKVDETTLTGEAELPSLSPLALRFDLVADRVRVDRYLEPPETTGKPFELPVAWLHGLDAQGTLRITHAEMLGAAARELTISVE